MCDNLHITSYAHCGLCMRELPDGESPSSYADYSVGFTKEGLQVFCNRHQVNIIHIDFQGMRHPASMDITGALQ